MTHAKKKIEIDEEDYERIKAVLRKTLEALNK
jgi:hypothetical protein